MGKTKIISKVLGMVATNCYVLANTQINECLIIDPADNAPEIYSMVSESGAVPQAVLLTHGHFDHIMALDEVRKHYGIKVYAYEDEQDVLMDERLNSSAEFGVPVETKADILLKDGEKITLAGLDITVFHTPGHTKGSCCYYLEDEKILMSGDTLFNQSIGRTDFPTGSMPDLLRSVREKLFVLPDDVKVYPGHEGETTIGFEKKYNPFF